MDDLNITMEEYTRLEKEKARKHGKVLNWEITKYGRIRYDEDIHDLRSVKTKFPAIVFNDNLTLNETLSCEPTISSLKNNEINFRISFDEFDDEDYTVIFDKNCCNDDLDFFKDFESEFRAIVYNDALMSKSNFSTEPTLCPQHINELDLKDETSFSEYDEVEQNVLYYNDLFLFNIIYPNDLKSNKDNDDNEIDMIQSSRSFYVSFGIPFGPKWYYKDGDYTRMLRRQDMAPLPPHEQRHPFHRDQVLRLCHRMMAHSIAGRSQEPEKIDEYIYAEIPDNIQHPRGYKLVTDLMMHEPCGAANLEFVLCPNSKKWQRRQIRKNKSLGRLTYVHPSSGDLFYFRMLLFHQKGCKSPAEVQTVNDQILPTYQAACEALGLLGDDKKQDISLQESTTLATSNEIRILFA
uniref:DNA helicase n=1 Tax=Tanacetum cinerariifolium TaxID=118510 RepID=A0A699GML9_TANCI|nr:DNA helicase [Tanacetum cinerariifolium]